MRRYIRAFCLALSALMLFFGLNGMGPGQTQAIAAADGMPMDAPMDTMDSEESDIPSPESNNPLRKFMDNVFGSGTSDKVEGQLDQASGKLQEEAGDMVGNPEMEAEGQKKQMEGNVEETIGNVKEQVSEAGQG